jgi:hypothetical protein
MDNSRKNYPRGGKVKFYCEMDDDIDYPHTAFEAAPTNKERDRR